MKCLSTPKPPKYLFAMISIVMVSLILLIPITSAFQGEPIPWGGTVFGLAIAVFIPMLLHWSNARTLEVVADSVWDCGDGFLVRHNGTETHYPLSRCVDVFWFRERQRRRCISITTEDLDGKLASFIFLHGIRSEEFPCFWKQPKLVGEIRQRIAAVQNSDDV